MKRTRTGTTIRQYAYATKRLNGQGRSKKEIALSVGFSESVAKNAKNKIESTEGYQNAVIQLAAESNNMVLAIMAEYKARGLKKFSNSDLNSAMNAIANAWEKFNKQRAPEDPNKGENPLRKVLMQRVENQTINVNTAPASTPQEIPHVVDAEVDDPLDF